MIEEVVPQVQFVPPQPQIRVGHPDPVDLREVGEQIGKELPQGQILAGPQDEDLDLHVRNGKEEIPKISPLPSVTASWSQIQAVWLVSPEYLDSRASRIRQFICHGGSPHDNSCPL